MKLLLAPFGEIFPVSIGDNTKTFHSHTINRFSSRNTMIYLQLISSLFNQIDCKNIQKSNDRLRLLTFNTWFSGIECHNGIAKIAHHIGEIKPDIVDNRDSTIHRRL